MADLKKLDWDSIWLPNEWPQCYDLDWQRKKTSEVLVPDYISVEFISKVVAFSSEAAKSLFNEVKKVARLLRTKLPNHNWTHLLKYKYSIDSTHYFRVQETRYD